MDVKTRLLIAVGTSVGANCHPCLEHSVGKALQYGIDREEIQTAMDVAKTVRQGAAASMEKLAGKLILEKTSATPAAGQAPCGCGCS